VPKVYVVRHRISRLIKQEIKALEKRGIQNFSDPAFQP
jgi:hypothetical protein